MSSQQSFPIEWQLSPLFKNDNDPDILIERKRVKNACQAFIQKWESRNDYTTSPAVLKQALDEYNQLFTTYGSYGTESYYFSLRTSQEEDNPTLKAKMNEVTSLSKQMDNALQFFTYRISKMPFDTQHRMLASKELVDYKHFLEQLFDEAKYLLSEDVEKVMNLKSKTSYTNWVMMTSTFLSKQTAEIPDSDRKKQTVTFEEVVSLMNDKNKNVRDAAAHSFNAILKKFVDVGESEINSILENKMIDDKLRNVERPDKLRHIADDIQTEVVDTLIKVVSQNYSVATDYYRLKAALMGVKKLAYHERNVEYGTVQKTYSYNDSVTLVQKVFSKLDAEFAEIFMSFVENGAIDVYPKKGKRGGAYCAHHLITNPTYILLNHTNQLNDVLTLAHESGHGINNELIKRKQNAINFGTPTSTAEVASTFMEDFVLQELLHQAHDEDRLSLLMTKLNSDISTIFRQIAAYQFEYALHEEYRKKLYLSKQEIGSLFQQYMKQYMGEAVEQSAGSENWWLYWTHIRYFFYNYSYASGLLISKSMQAQVKKDKNFIQKVKEFLSAGKAQSPKDIFLNLGIDIQNRDFWVQGVQEVKELLKETQLLATKLGKI